MRIASTEAELPLEAGGKARGLFRLRALGLPVPAAFVVLLPDADDLDEAALAQHLSRLGPGRKAVRSSAVSEDGARASFAGQFETVLGVDGANEVVSAIRRCLHAAGSDRVQSYARGRGAGADLRLSVVVQDLVEARWSGVVFSADPVSGRRDLTVINATSGLGDQLVDGRAAAMVYKVHEGGAVVAKPPESAPGLPDSLLQELCAGAARVASALGAPADLEWAVDQGGTLWWLQARPVTTLPDVNWNELDAGPRDRRTLWTLSNVGEMLPGAITPLTISVSAWAIDRSIQILTRSSGAQSDPPSDFRTMGIFYNRFFFNVSALYDLARHVAFNEKESVELSIAGRLIPEVPADEVQKVGSPLLRGFHFLKQIASISRPVAQLEKLKALCAAQREYEGHDAGALHQALDGGRQQLCDAFGYHLLVSAWSGTLYTAMIRVLTKNARPPEAEDHRVATLLLGAIPGIAGAEAVRALDELADQLAVAPSLADEFLAVFAAGDLASASATIARASHPIGGLWTRFLEDHGHRCVRESELHERPWREDPGPPLSLLATRLGGLRGRPRRRGAGADRPATGTSSPSLPRPLDRGQRLALSAMLPSARAAVARREQSKSLSIRFLDGLRRGYQRLAKLLVAAGRLPDAELAFFLTHHELGLIAHGPSPHLVAKAEARRRQQPALAALDFGDLGRGVPLPIEPHTVVAPHDGALWGIPVSAGVVEGPVRVVRTVEESRAVRPGDVLVAPFTDVGWTPCFPVIAGLVTELGSPLSHGAVVAREYGLPAVVSVRGATTALRSGDRVRVDGLRGIVERLD